MLKLETQPQSPSSAVCCLNSGPISVNTLKPHDGQSYHCAHHEGV